MKAKSDTTLGANIKKTLRDLNTDELNILLDRTAEIHNATKIHNAGFHLYVNLYKPNKLATIEIVLKHEYENVEESPQYRWMHTIQWNNKKINDSVHFDLTTGSYDGIWDEDTISLNYFYDLLDISLHISEFESENKF